MKSISKLTPDVLFLDVKVPDLMDSRFSAVAIAATHRWSFSRQL
jgi:hypothetical protein